MHRDLALLAALLLQPDHPAACRVLKVLQPEACHRAHSGAGVGQAPNHRAIAQPAHARRVDGPQKVLDLADGDLGRAPLDHRDPLPPHGQKRIRLDDVSGNQQVCEVAQGRKRLVLGQRPHGQLFDPAPGDPGRHVAQRDAGRLQVLEEAADPTAVGPASVRVGDPSVEELVGSDHGGRACLVEHGRNGRAVPGWQTKRARAAI